MISNKLLNEIEKARLVIDAAAKPWRAQSFFSIDYVAEMPQGYHLPNTGRVVLTPVLRISVTQDEENEFLAPMPDLPVMRLYDPRITQVRFYAELTELRLSENPPSDKVWKDLANFRNMLADVERMTSANKSFPFVILRYEEDGEPAIVNAFSDYSVARKYMLDANESANDDPVTYKLLSLERKEHVKTLHELFCSKS